MIGLRLTGNLGFTPGAAAYAAMTVRAPEIVAASRLASAIDTLRAMRAKITNVYSGVEQYQLVTDTANGAPIDTRSGTYRVDPSWGPAWLYVSDVLRAGYTAFPPPGLTLIAATRVLDQVLLYWGAKKLQELQDAAAKITAEQAAVARAKAEAEQTAEAEAAARAAEAAAKEAARLAAERSKKIWIGVGVGAGILAVTGIVFAATRRKDRKR